MSYRIAKSHNCERIARVFESHETCAWRIEPYSVQGLTVFGCSSIIHEKENKISKSSQTHNISSLTFEVATYSRFNTA